MTYYALGSGQSKANLRFYLFPLQITSCTHWFSCWTGAGGQNTNHSSSRWLKIQKLLSVGLKPASHEQCRSRKHSHKLMWVFFRHNRAPLISVSVCFENFRFLVELELEMLKHLFLKTMWMWFYDVKVLKLTEKSEKLNRYLWRIKSHSVGTERRCK